MDVFYVGVLTLLTATAVFYVVLFGFIFYWHLRKTTFVIVPVIWTFEFFIRCFWVVVIVSLILHYLPILIAY